MLPRHCFRNLAGAHKCEANASSWVTARGGFGGPESLPMPVATSAADGARVATKHLSTFDPSWQ
eukprot:5766593-Pyramimonas_sp.AAC.1